MRDRTDRSRPSGRLLLEEEEQRSRFPVQAGPPQAAWGVVAAGIPLPEQGRPLVLV